MKAIPSKPYLIIELICMFILLPAVIYLWSPHMLLPLLWLLAIIAATLLIKDKCFERNTLWAIKPLISDRTLVLQAIILFIISALLLYAIAPDLLFGLIREDPLLWVLVMLFYPLLSVYPQEMIYRSFFFHRYRHLIKSPTVSILFNALLFGYMHIIFHNWIAVALTFIGGLFFAYLYLRSRSLLFVSMVH
ncbi:MAG: CPBP family intramembrane glutamic endopeptidase, partial [Sulfurovum sp.]